MGEKFKKNIRFIIGTLVMFMCIAMLALSINSLSLFSSGIVISPLVMFFFVRKVNMKSKKYYLSLLGIFAGAFILAASITASSHDAADNYNNNNEIGTYADNNVDEDVKKKDTEDVQENKAEEEEKDKNTDDEAVEDKGTNDKVVEEHIGTSPSLETTEAKVHFINTGNSDAILIVQGDKAVLVDAGNNDDEGLVTNYIKQLGITNINYLISTHPDADHCGGLDAVINNFGIGQFFVGNGSADTKTYTDVITAAANKGVNPSVPLEDSIFNLTDNSYIQFFNTAGGSDSNEGSLVTLFVNGEDKFLLTGDAGNETENKIASKLPDIDVLKVGHHGSKGSTSQRFLDKVAPEYAVILTGKNSYSHPAGEVLNRLQAADIELHRSDECGDIVFTSTGQGVATECAVGSFTPGETSSAAQNSGSTSYSTGSNISSGQDNSEPAVQTPVETPAETPTGQMVWLSETGNKYHSINNCGRMNPDKARQVTIDEAISQGMTACTKCN